MNDEFLKQFQEAAEKKAKADREKALEELTQIKKDQVITINDINYDISELLKLDAEKQYDFVVDWSTCEQHIQQTKDLSYTKIPQYTSNIEKMSQYIMIGNSMLSKLPNHFNEHKKNRIKVFDTAFKVLTSEFL